MSDPSQLDDSSLSASQDADDMATLRVSPPVSAAAPDDLQTLIVPKPTKPQTQSVVPSSGANPAAPVPFVFGRRIAQGGMGAILEASDCKLGRTIAVKVMLAEAGGSEEQKQRFIQEAAVLGRLEHPNIVPIHDLGLDSEGQLFYTMKLVKGRTLQHILDELRHEHPEDLQHYTLDRLLTIFRKVCDALAFAHASNIIHRDLKPENVMVGEFGEVLVMDWGIAKIMEELGTEVVSTDASARPPVPTGTGSFTATMDGAVMGTPNYMSPEQAMGKVNELDERSDIFSLGGILYAILTLRPPVEGKDVWEVLEKVQMGNITEPTKFGATTGKGTAKAKSDVLEAKKITPLPHMSGGRVPNALSAVVMKALTLDKTKRYPNVAAFSADIEKYQGGFATTAENAGIWKQTVLLVRRHKGVFATAAAAWVLITALAGWFVVNVTRERNRAATNEKRALDMLADLRGTAPTFEAQSRALLNDGKLDDALEKIGYATQLVPENADYALARAHLLESTQRLSAAEEEYRRVLALRPGDAAAQENLELCAKLLTASGGAAELPEAQQNQLLDALIAQHRDVEGVPLAARLHRDSETTRKAILARLSFYTSQPDWNAARLSQAGARFVLYLHQFKLGDLNVLRGLPISKLSLNLTSLSDLRPLAGLPLEELVISNTLVSDLSPLRGMKLRRLHFHGSKVSDITPLTGMPLEVLWMSDDVPSLEPLRGMPLKELNLLQNALVRDLSPLAGMPLETLVMNCPHVTDIGPLRGMPLKELDLCWANVSDCSPLAGNATLEKIHLPVEIADIAFLRTLPRLQQVDLRVDSYAPPVWISTRDFLATHDPELPEIKTARAALAAHGVSSVGVRRITLDKDRRLVVNLSHLQLTDLEGLRGLPISRLSLADNPLTTAHLEALRGLPLVFLDLRNTHVRDVAPLAGFRDLEEIVFGDDRQGGLSSLSNVEQLRALPKLRRISLRTDANDEHPAQTAEEFWKEFDAKRAAGKK